jgi:hypothetical protein
MEYATHAQRIIDAGFGAIRNYIMVGTEPLFAVSLRLLRRVSYWESENLRQWITHQ